MDFEIPLFDLNYGPEEAAAAARTIASGWLSMGPNVQAFEERFAARLDCKHALAVTNCTASLHLALAVLDIGPGDEVIVPSLTFVATVNAIRYVGADPVFADIRGPHDLSLDPEDVATLFSERTKAVMVMHYGGFAADMDPLLTEARNRGVAVIEDAAHAPLAFYGERALGTLGDVGCFSFFANKNITCAEGGALVTNRPDLAERARLMRAHGMTTMSFERAKGHATGYDVLELGFNYRMDDIRASLILAQLDRLDDDVSRRSVVRGHYEERLAGLSGVVVPYLDFEHRSSHYIMPLVLEEGGVERRERVREGMAKRGIQTSVHYPAVHRFSIYEEYRRPLPRTERAADHEITLPMYPALTDEQVGRVCDALEASL